MSTETVYDTLPGNHLSVVLRPLVALKGKALRQEGILIRDGKCNSPDALVVRVFSPLNMRHLGVEIAQSIVNTASHGFAYTVCVRFVLVQGLMPTASL